MNILEVKKSLRDIDPKYGNIKIDTTVGERFAKMHCKDAYLAYKSEQVIYRGIKKTVEPWSAYVIDPKKHTRTHRVDSVGNFYHFLLGMLPSWKNYPKREHSLVCTSDKNLAARYGTVFEVFPMDGAKIAISSGHDFWVSFPYTSKRFSRSGTWDLWMFNKFFNLYFQTEYSIGNVNRLRSVSSISSLLAKFPPKITWESWKNANTTLVGDVITSLKDIETNAVGRGWIEYFDELLNPESNQFKLIDISNYNVSSSGNAHEVWTDAKSVLINDEGYSLDDEDNPMFDDLG